MYHHWSELTGSHQLKSNYCHSVFSIDAAAEKVSRVQKGFFGQFDVDETFADTQRRETLSMQALSPKVPLENRYNWFLPRYLCYLVHKFLKHLRFAAIYILNCEFLNFLPILGSRNRATWIGICESTVQMAMVRVRPYLHDSKRILHLLYRIHLWTGVLCFAQNPLPPCSVLRSPRRLL